MSWVNRCWVIQRFTRHPGVTVSWIVNPMISITPCWVPCRLPPLSFRVPIRNSRRAMGSYREESMVEIATSLLPESSNKCNVVFRISVQWIAARGFFARIFDDKRVPFLNFFQINFCKIFHCFFFINLHSKKRNVQKQLDSEGRKHAF